jgi:hypothetical protein
MQDINGPISQTNSNIAQQLGISAKYYWAIPILAVLLMRLPYFGLQVMNSDEGLYASVARAMQRGGIPYRDAWDHAAPGIFYLYRAAFSVFGDWNMIAVRLLAFFAHAGSAVIIGLYFRKSHGDLIGAMAATMIGVAIGAYLPSDVIAALTETFMLPPLLYVAVMLLRWKDDNKVNIFLSGVLIAISIWFKIHALILVIGLLIGIIMARSLSQKSLMQDIFICVKIMTIAYFGYLMLILPILLRDGWESYLSMYIQYNIHYMQAGKYDEFFVIGFGKTLFQWAAPNFILTTLAIYGYISLLRNSEYYARGVFLTSGLVASILIGTAGARLFGHYFIPLFALLGWGAVEGMVIILSKMKNKGLSGTRRNIVMSVIFLLTITFPLYYFHGFAYSSRMEMMQKGISMGDKFPRLVSKIEEISSTDDQIWVWGFAPEIYVSAKRDCANRFINCNYLVGLIPWVNVSPQIDTSSESVPNSWNLLKADLRRNPPELIIDVSVANYQFWGRYQLSTRPALDSFVKRNYSSIGLYDNFMLYKLK